MLMQYCAGNDVLNEYYESGNVLTKDQRVTDLIRNGFNIATV